MKYFTTAKRADVRQSQHSDYTHAVVHADGGIYSCHSSLTLALTAARKWSTASVEPLVEITSREAKAIKNERSLNALRADRTNMETALGRLWIYSALDEIKLEKRVLPGAKKQAELYEGAKAELNRLIAWSEFGSGKRLVAEVTMDRGWYRLPVSEWGVCYWEA